jgi:protein-S-isoprenylcysteine O-methyltransferase Ste14
VNAPAWRHFVFKNRGAILVPVAAGLAVFGKPSLYSALGGTAVALGGELLRIWAVGYSGTTTRAGVVTAPRLVTAGPYALMRNPLYVGNSIIAFGFCWGFGGHWPPAVRIAALAGVLLFVFGLYAAIVPLEEEYLAAAFGAQYVAYRRTVPRIVPRPPAPQTERYGFWDGAVILKAEVITLAFFAAMTAVLFLEV